MRRLVLLLLALLCLPVRAGAFRAAADFDGDGRADLLWRNAATGAVYVMPMKGLSAQAGAVVWTEADPAWQIVATADFDGDGRSDLLWWNLHTGQVYLMTLDGPSVKGGTLVTTEPDNAWRIVGAGDVDGDGRADLIWRHASGMVYVMPMGPSGPRAGAVVHTEPDPAWRLVAVADLDGDGRADLVWRNAATGLVWGQLLDGCAVKAQGPLWQESDPAWSLAGAADVDGDGKADLVWRNADSGLVWLMPMDGLLAKPGHALHTEPDPRWHIVALADLDGDGRADLVWWHETAGLVWGMLLDGTGIRAQGALWVEPDPAWRIQEAGQGTPVLEAAFTLPSPALAGQPLAFADATGGAAAWNWSFGDGTSSAERNPVHAYAAAGTYTVTLLAAGPAGLASHAATLAVGEGDVPWRFAFVADTHVGPDPNLAGELAAAMAADGPRFVLAGGDLAEGGAACSATTLQAQLMRFQDAMGPLARAGVPVLPVRGNHEADVPGGLDAWKAAFSGPWAPPTGGPTGQEGLTFAFTWGNALVVGLDEYVDLHRVDQAWLDGVLDANTRPHVFVFGHEPAFKVRHDDGLDDEAAARDLLWTRLAAAGARTYLCGHDHFLDAARLDDGQGGADADLVQVVAGTGGGELMDTWAYNGVNSLFTPVQLAHRQAYGYLLVEVSGSRDEDRDVTLAWKERTVDASGAVTYVPAWTWSYRALPRVGTYPVVDTSETDCYDATKVIPAPRPGEPFYGQDPQIMGLQPSYLDLGDGTVADLSTGLQWVKDRGSRTPWADARAGAAACRVGGYTDWRMPTIKELYSLIRFTGVQGTSMTSTAGYVPFLDTSVFGFAYGAGTATERVIDCQDWSATADLAPTMVNSQTAFGVNFADGRIKGYPSGQRPDGTYVQDYVRYVRGNPQYGRNHLVANGDGTVTDLATGLMWSQADSGAGMDWQTALAWVQARNAEAHLGHTDWRMPNVKELQSILDYTWAPDARIALRQGPALDPLFSITALTNEGGVQDWPFFWSGTNFQDGFKDGTPTGVAAAYVAFGRALGWMKLNGQSTYTLLDVHGAGAQRSDPKAGDPTTYTLGTDASGRPAYGRGPQGDVVRIQNFVRLVRTATP